VIRVTENCSNLTSSWSDNRTTRNRSAGLSHHESRRFESFRTQNETNFDLLAKNTYFSQWNPAIRSARIPHMSEPRTVVVYSRKGCHLCEVVKESLNKLSRRGGFTWREIDVDGDLELRRQFNDEVPVVFIDGRKAFKYRMDEQEFLRKLAS
jgi:glutaredoxin